MPPGCYTLMCEKGIYGRKDIFDYQKRNGGFGVKDEPSDELKAILSCWSNGIKCDEKLHPRGTWGKEATPSSEAKSSSPRQSPRQSSQTSSSSFQQTSRAQSQQAQSSKAKSSSPRQSPRQASPASSFRRASRKQSQRAQSHRSQSSSSRQQQVASDIDKCVEISKMTDFQLKDELRKNELLMNQLESLKIDTNNIKRIDLIANLIKKRIFPNSKMPVLPLQFKHSPSNDWWRLAVYVGDLIRATKENYSDEEVEILKSKVIDSLEVARINYGAENDSIRAEARENTRNERVAAERKEAEREAARVSAAQEAAEAAAAAEAAKAAKAAEVAEAAEAAKAAKERLEAKEAAAKSRFTRFASRVTRKSPSPAPIFNIGDRVLCRDNGSLVWFYGTVTATEPELLVRTDTMYGVPSLTGTWDEVRHRSKSLVSRLAYDINKGLDKTFTGIESLQDKVKRNIPGFSRKVPLSSVKIGGKRKQRKQTRKRRKSLTITHMKIGKRLPQKKTLRKK